MKRREGKIARTSRIIEHLRSKGYFEPLCASIQLVDPALVRFVGDPQAQADETIDRGLDQRRGGDSAGSVGLREALRDVVRIVGELGSLLGRLPPELLHQHGAQHAVKGKDVGDELLLPIGGWLFLRHPRSGTDAAESGQPCPPRPQEGAAA